MSLYSICIFFMIKTYILCTFQDTCFFSKAYHKLIIIFDMHKTSNQLVFLVVLISY